MKKIILIFLVSTITLNLFSQVAVGEWRDHFSFRNVLMIQEAEEEYFLATSNGIFTYNKADKTKEKITKTTGLSDIGISTINYYNEKELLVIGYENGNIDIIVDKEITNISDIKNKNIAAAKNIFNVVFLDNFAFLSCGFGIIKFNLETFEIIETYYIGDEASLISIFDIIIYNDKFYVATENGIYYANTQNQNLIDFNNWTRIEDIPNYDKKITDICVFNDKIYAMYQESTEQQKKIIYYLENDTWQLFKESLSKTAKMYASTDKFIVVTKSKIYLYNENLLNVRNIENSETLSLNANSVFIDSNGVLWISDMYQGVLEEQADYSYNSIFMNGPYHLDTYKIKSYEGKTVATMGGFSPGTGENNWNNGATYFFNDNYWTNKTNEDAFDYYAISFNPEDNNNVFIGSWGDGVMEYQDGEIVNTYDMSNSPLESANGEERYVRVSSLYCDNESNLWVLNNTVEHSVNVLKADKTWMTFEFNGVLHKKKTIELIGTENNHIWIVLGKTGLFVLDYNNTIDNTTDDLYKKFYPSDETGEDLGQEIKAIAEDLDGNIWIASNEGVAVVYNPTEFSETGFYVNRIKITAELNDTLITAYLLKEEVVNAIAIDGANRKWFGTANSGVYLMSEDGTEELLHFTEKNSPLPSNHILSIAVDELSGEVFFATSSGLISYRSDATEGDSDFNDVYVFPNPVKETYTGIITIKGLVENADVKITDIAGNIVYQTTALGGQASWNGNNMSGRRVQTGVYLVFCTNDDGSKTHVTKLLFIN